MNVRSEPAAVASLVLATFFGWALRRGHSLLASLALVLCLLFFALAFTGCAGSSQPAPAAAATAPAVASEDGGGSPDAGMQRTVAPPRDITPRPGNGGSTTDAGTRDLDGSVASLAHDAAPAPEPDASTRDAAPAPEPDASTRDAAPAPEPDAGTHDAGEADAGTLPTCASLGPTGAVATAASLECKQCRSDHVPLCSYAGGWACCGESGDVATEKPVCDCGVMP